LKAALARHADTHAALNAVVATVGTVDRRFLLGVLGAAVWMWYWASLRYKRTTPVVARLSVAAAGLILLIGAYTGIRHAVGGTEGATLAVRAAQFTELARKGSIERGSFAMMFFQDTPNNTLFIIENYPEVYALRPLNGAGVVISNPVPRFFWPGKPEGLGIALQKQMGVEANLGTGIIGHGWAEGLYLGVIGYAVFFGLFVGAIDRVIRARAGNPYFLAAIGCSLGNILALPRGETSIFFLFAIVGFFATVMVLWLTRLVLGAFMQAGQPLWAFPVAADGGGAAGDGTDGLEPFDPDAPDDPYAGWDVPAETIQLDYAVAAAQNGMNGHGAPAPAAASSPAPKRG